MYETDRRPRGERDAHKLLYAGFVAAPIIAGVDKFTDRLTTDRRRSSRSRNFRRDRPDRAR